MVRSVVAVAALLASVSASAGELDGKGLICEREKQAAGEMVWFKFEERQAVMYWLETMGTKAQVTHHSMGAYALSPTKVIWGDSVKHELDRQTLIFESYRLGMLSWRAQCEVTESVEAVKDSIEAALSRKQQAIEEQMKGNKI